MILFISRLSSRSTKIRFSALVSNINNKHLKFFIPLLLFLVSFNLSSFGQVTGDYKSNNASFNWDVYGSWLRYNGTTWVPPTPAQGYPGFSNSPATVTISTANIVYLTASPTNTIGNLVIVGTGQLTVNSSTTYTFRLR